MTLHIDHDHVTGIDVVRVNGDLDIYTAPVLREDLKDLIGEQARDVVVDLSAVPVLDSMGLGVLVGALKRARTFGGTVRLAGPTAMAAKTLRITGLTKVFSLHPDVPSALRAPFELPTSTSDV